MMLDRLLASRYQLIQPLGMGGFGKTFLAKDVLLPGSPHCVVKHFQPALDDSKFLEIARRLFLKEAETLQQLGRHDQIPQLLAYFEQEREFYLVQDFIDGTPLQEELTPGQPWSESKVIKLLQDCLQIIEFVHRHGVIHRDIKPDNLMRRHLDHKIALLDFGAVKQIRVGQDQRVERTVSIGTEGYAPDEQLRGKPHFSSDLYALGMIGIQALTGLHPTQLSRGEDDEIIWQSQALVSPEVAVILSRLVRRDYRQRYSSASDALTALKTIHSATAVLAAEVARATAPVSSPERVKQSASIQAESIHSSTAAPAVAASVSQTTLQVVLPPKIDASPSSPDDAARPIASLDGAAADREVTGETKRVLSADSTMVQSHFQWFKSAKVTCMSLILLLTGAAAAGVYLTRKVEMAQVVQQLESLHDQEKYEECIGAAEAAIANQNIPEQVIGNSLAPCHLGAAQVKADQSRFLDAIRSLAQISPDSPYYDQSQQKMAHWSSSVLAYATKIYEEEGKLKQALAVVDQIPDTSSISQEAAKRSQKWQDDYQVNNALIKKAQLALDAGQLETAIARAQKIKAPQYWQQQAEKIKQTAATKIASKRPAPIPRWKPAPSTWKPAPVVRARPWKPAPTPVARSWVPAPAPKYSPPPAPAPRYIPAPPVPKLPQKLVVKICPGPLCTE